LNDLVTRTQITLKPEDVCYGTKPTGQEGKFEVFTTYSVNLRGFVNTILCKSSFCYMNSFLQPAPTLPEMTISQPGHQVPPVNGYQWTMQYNNQATEYNHQVTQYHN
jgi:hypothetical protein